MAFDPMDGIPMLDLHVARMQKSADELSFRFDRHALRNELQAATFGQPEPKRVRVLLSRSGAVAIEVRARQTWPKAVVPVCIVPRTVGADDVRIRHKTTDRRPYRAALEAGGTFEVLMTDESGYLTEGCFSSIFVERGDRLVTPPLARGLLAGVLRQSLMNMGEAVEGELRPSDLEKGFFIGNAARGLVAATLVRR
jgi:4-amino-4-deoxychorismate lyase/para-aminobenzoate synthetase/4-amino-4-deoxychorismate lyase